jgi:hypothetical protein
MGDSYKTVNYTEELKLFNRPYLFGRHTYWRSRIAALIDKPEKTVSLLNESFAQENRFGVYVYRIIDFETLWNSFDPCLKMTWTGKKTMVFDMEYC